MIHLNSSTIFVNDKLHRSFWSFLDNILELSFFVSYTQICDELCTMQSEHLTKAILDKACDYTLKGKAVMDHNFYTNWSAAICVQSTVISRDLLVPLCRLIAADQFSWAVLSQCGHEDIDTTKV